MKNSCDISFKKVFCAIETIILENQKIPFSSKIHHKIERQSLILRVTSGYSYKINEF